HVHLPVRLLFFIRGQGLAAIAGPVEDLHQLYWNGRALAAECAAYQAVLGQEPELERRLARHRLQPEKTMGHVHKARIKTGTGFHSGLKGAIRARFLAWRL